MNRFVFKRALKNILGSFSYNPEKYWTERGKTLEKENLYDGSQFRIQEKALVEYLSKLEFSSVLEIGCGFGRITKLMINNFPNIKSYSAIDISPDNISKTKKLFDSQKINFQVSTIQNYNPSEKYDLVLSVYVLMHVPPKEIEQVIKKSVNLSQKHVVNVDWFEQQKSNIHLGHNFIHNYDEIYEKNPSNLKVKQVPIGMDNPPTSLFHAQIDHR
jgi:2-polyprenyl-3-methyl-5-hydroxy-6-metoxy-1,4-benzoquinol methylase